MANLTAVIRQAKANKDGYCKVQIAISHKRETAYISTDVKVRPANFKSGIILNKEPNYIAKNNEIQELLSKFNAVVHKLVRPDVLTSKQIKDLLIAEGKKDRKFLTIEGYLNEMCLEYDKMGRESMKTMMSISIRRFTEYTKGDICLSDITSAMVQGFKEWLQEQTKEKVTKTKYLNEFGLVRYKRETEVVPRYSGGTISITLSNLRTLINRAINDGTVVYAISPVHKMGIPQTSANDVSISIQAMNKLLSYKGTNECRQQVIDIFAISFYLGGINLVDLLGNKFDLSKDSWSYVRRKTRFSTKVKNEIVVPLFKPAKDILEKYINDDGYFIIPNNFQTEDGVSGWINRRLKRIAEELDIEERVCYNSARKSFSQYAFELGFSETVINYCIGHSDARKGVMRFYTKVAYKQATLCMAKVFAYAKDPEKYEKEIEDELNRLVYQDL